MDKISILKSVKMNENSIVEIAYTNNMKISLKNLDQVLKNVYKITENKRVSRLTILGENIDITKAVRRAITEKNKCNKNLIIAEAVFLNSFNQGIKLNFYMRLIKRKYPLNCFVDIKSANECLTKKDNTKMNSIKKM